VKMFALQAKQFLATPGIPQNNNPQHKNRSDRGPEEWISEFALRLGSVPWELREWSRDGLRTGLEYLLDNPTLARAARYVVLAVDHSLPRTRLDEAHLYNGWDWK
ncbi:MAG: hypothetical protein MN733_06740, partial [Nitrososphaera sp.]|nr:hypothetical protein [Nitrososphaera sp.]